MKKLQSAVLYEYSTKLRAMCIFYAIQYAAVALIFLIIAICTGSGNVGSNVLEISTIVFVSIMGVLGYQEDFKALIQNGYTRRYIFLATICMFVLMTGTMALIDTVIGTSIHRFHNHYFTLYGILYGYSNPFANWLWLTVLYLAFCCLFYLGMLVIHKIGRLYALSLGVALGGVILLIAALFRFVFSSEFVGNTVKFLMRAMGFMADGSANPIFPILTFFLLGSILGCGAYAILRRTELK